MPIFYTDDRLIELMSQSNDPSNTWSAIWETITHEGTPLVDEDSLRMTFLFDAAAVSDMDVESVHVWINRLTDKERVTQGFMKNIPGTTVWARTVEVPPSLRAAYCFRINAGEHRPPGHNRYPHRRDPHARNGHLVIDGDYGLSLLQGPDVVEVPESSAWQHVDLAHPSRSITSSISGLPTYLYLPIIPHKDLPLVVLIDADVWFQRLKLDQVLDYLIAQGHMPACAVLGIGFTDPARRRQLLGANNELTALLTGPAVEYAQRQAQSAGHTIAHDTVIIAGQSLGGLTSLWAALRHPDRIRSVIASSPSLWWRPEDGCTPADLATINVPWLVEQILTEAPNHSAHSASDTCDAPPPAYLDVGIREGMSVAHMHGLHFAMTSRNWEHRFEVWDGGHDFAWWREALPHRLSQALRTLPPATVNYQ